MRNQQNSMPFALGPSGSAFRVSQVCVNDNHEHKSDILPIGCKPPPITETSSARNENPPPAPRNLLGGGIGSCWPEEEAPLQSVSAANVTAIDHGYIPLHSAAFHAPLYTKPLHHSSRGSVIRALPTSSARKLQKATCLLLACSPS